jgi:transcriptional regulator with GAF, ATPase, and Fis domain
MLTPMPEGRDDQGTGDLNATGEARSVADKKFPDLFATTKIQYVGDGGPRLHLRKAKLVWHDGDKEVERSFDQGQIRLGAMEDNDVVLRDETSSRYHAKILQDTNGYLILDNGSTNGTFVNRVRVREAYLRHGCTIHLGESELKFWAGEEDIEILPSRKDYCGDLVGGHPRMREIYSIIEKIAPTNTTVVIEGETGTGKEVVAQTIHRLSPRGGGPIMVFDCGAVPENLIESELFGHEKGSFTGAIMTRQGLFEMGDTGTIFLDELGELPLDLQPKLLRALEQREIRRVGGARSMKVDVRIIAATNRNLEDEVRAGRFRQDLFYRLSVVRLVLPPLRERAEDIPMLVRHILANNSYNKSKGGEAKVKKVSSEAMSLMSAYRWPGNVRELVNAIERAVSFAETDTIEPHDLPETVREGTGAPSRAGTQSRAQTNAPARPQSVPPQPFLSPAATATPARPGPESFDATFKDAKERWVATFERDYVLTILRKNNGNISHAAREADIDRKYFRKLMKKYDIEAAGASDDDDVD